MPPPTPTATDPTIIERDLYIAASPETVYTYFTDPARLAEWFGRRAEIDPHPGGLLRVDFNGFDIMRGSFLELTPPSRVVYTWGWESLNADAVQPGGSRVEITLSPENGGTRLHLVHSDLPAHALGAHGIGWDYGLRRLVAAVGGQPEPPLVGDLSPGEALAARLNTLLIEAAALVSACPEERWTRAATDADPRLVNVIADHLAGHLALVELADAVAHGGRTPLADLTDAGLEAANQQHARTASGVSRGDVLHRIRTQGPKAVETLKALDAPALGNAQPMAFAAGAPMTAQAVAEGPVLHDIQEHVATLRIAIQG